MNLKDICTPTVLRTANSKIEKKSVNSRDISRIVVSGRLCVTILKLFQLMNCIIISEVLPHII